jgi:hypothetical protein
VVGFRDKLFAGQLPGGSSVATEHNDWNPPRSHRIGEIVEILVRIEIVRVGIEHDDIGSMLFGQL